VLTVTLLVWGLSRRETDELVVDVKELLVRSSCLLFFDDVVPPCPSLMLFRHGGVTSAAAFFIRSWLRLLQPSGRSQLEAEDA